MPRVFTIFNHGTDFHRDAQPQEVVTQLHNAVSGPEAQLSKKGPGADNWGLAYDNPTHLICEGPGSEEVVAELSSSGRTHAHPGKYNPIFNTKKEGTPQALGLTPKGHKKYGLFGDRGYDDFQKSFSGDTTERKRGTGRALGRGWDDNVYKAVFTVTHLAGIGQRPDVINIVGWSRGAVTCLKMANKFYEVYENTIALNIFAIDPVIGGLTWTYEDMTTIPPNVRNYMAVLALDDDRGNFQPTSRKELRVQVPVSRKHPVPNIVFLPLPGNHSDMVACGSTKEAEGSGMMCLHLAWKFLSSHGTVFSPNSKAKSWDLPVSLVRQIYAVLGRNMKTIRKNASSGLVGIVGGVRSERDVRKNRSEYVRGGSLYINEHHRQCVLMPSIQAQQPGNLTFEQTVLDSSTKFFQPVPYADLFQMGITYTRV